MALLPLSKVQSAAARGEAGFSGATLGRAFGYVPVFDPEVKHQSRDRPQLWSPRRCANWRI
jgi:hypothetical protein